MTDERIVDATGVGEVSAPPTALQPAPKKKIKELSKEEFDDYNLKTVQKHRAKKAAEKSEAARKPDSSLELTPKEAKELLSDSGLSENVVTTCVRFGEATAGVRGVPANRFFWTRPESDKTETVSGEVLYRFELEALYHCCVDGREILGAKPSFAEWLALRFKAKTDLWFLCVDVAKKGLVEQTHREMVDFFVKKDPRLLKPGYDQEYLKSVLYQQDAQHTRLLLFPRSNYKSTVNVLDLVQWLLNFPDIRALVITSTHPLGKSFIAELRRYFVVRSVHSPSTLNLLFPEFSIADSDGSETVFRCPAATLGLKENSVWSSAVDADSVGFHCDLLVFDDAVSEINSSGPEMRDKVTSRFDMISELVDKPWGFVQVLGTRYAGGESPDLYGRLLQRADEEDDSDLKVLIKGAWAVLPHARHKKIHELLEHDVELLFPFGPNGEPGKGSWKVLQKKLKANERTFRQQQLNEAIDDDVENLVTFSEELLRAAVRPSKSFSNGTRIYRVMSVDQAQSTGRYADYSCLLVADVLRINENGAEKNIFFVIAVRLERMRTSGVGNAIATMASEYNVERCVIEQSGDWQTLGDYIREAARVKGIILPHIFWKPTSGGASGTGVNRKASRIKRAMEPLLNEKRLFFSDGIAVLEECIQQCLKFDGLHRSNNTRKDDFPDCCALGISTFMPHTSQEPTDEQRELFEEQARIQQHLKAQKDWYFGNLQAPVHNGPQYTEPEQPRGGIYGTLGRFNLLKH